ncbi:DivIVA domain-containing protein [Listeria grayi]|uniref:Septum site-determining protein divIVA n=2 Tax=Listeria grayi TaxID=1641 RepID=D7UXQ9_LISGR|nr:DivIVA domain-containing protein [Listeria grayi]EFI84467.1 septum site-determining protein divIVA [Listeria grayi DSM 20601]EUJ29256.1 cell-division initiation protein DivIVA [Listeria grayi FSL F6-1183]MBC1922266.1 DivIVA domain-containing protein [Listeria grayi]
MPLSPLDIHNKEFTRSFRGYDEDEVNDFLDQIIKDYEQLIKEKKKLEDTLNNSEERLGHFTNIEETLNKSLIVAQTAAEEVKHSANKEAKLIVREAEKNADRILGDSLSKARKVAIEIEDLKRQSKVFRERLKMLVEAQMDLIKSDDWQQLMSYDVDATELKQLKEVKQTDEDGDK